MDPECCLNSLSAELCYVIVNACATFEHIHVKVNTSGFGENQQTYKLILYTLVNVTQLGPAVCVQLNFKLVTD